MTDLMQFCYCLDDGARLRAILERCDILLDASEITSEWILLHHLGSRGVGAPAKVVEQLILIHADKGIESHESIQWRQ